MKALVIGGTGTLGQELVSQLLAKRSFTEVRVLSRDEFKQHQIRFKFKNKKLVTHLGDIRELSSVVRAVEGMDVVFHVAALKQVPAIEEFPSEAIKTNVLGTMNVKEACERAKVKYLAFSSTDKACYPINAYGYSKALCEKVLRANKTNKLNVTIFRWGNIVGSRGSVFEGLVFTLLRENIAWLTHKDMSRFWLRIETAAKFMIDSFDDTKGEVLIPPHCKAARMQYVAMATARVLGVNQFDYKYTGIRPGEKLSECLLTKEEGGPFDSSNSAPYNFKELVDLIRPTVLHFKSQFETLPLALRLPK